uniref:Mitochondrial import inner membrane translocase subunit TIM50 n=1 Tax=Steinernema glaseri TaxID=37863 RepID=A0A1I7ZEY8_9BILA
MATTRFIHFSTATSSRLLFQQRVGALSRSCRLFASGSDERPKGFFSAVHGDRVVQSPFDNPRRMNATTVKIEKPSESVPPAQKEVEAESVAQPIKETVREPVVDSTPYVEEAKSEPIAAAATYAAAASSAAENQGITRKLSERFGLHIDENLSEDEKKRQKATRNTMLGAFFVFGGSLSGFIWFCLHYGRAQRDEAGNIIEDEFSGSYFAPFYRVMKAYHEWRDYVVEPSRKLLLPDPLPAPYLQPKYTLVIEMKNVLVNPEWSYKDGHRFKKRPALDYFLDIVGYPNFEVVIYTSESGMTADPVMHSVDPKQRIMYKLYRDCTKYMKGHHVKDLSRLNRDLSKVIYIDFDPQSFQLNPENVLRVPKWEGDMNDTSLVDLAELLKTIHLSDVEDVRPTLQYYSQFDDPAKEFRNRALYVAQQEQKRKEESTGQNQGFMSKYSGWIPGRRHRV